MFVYGLFVISCCACTANSKSVSRHIRWRFDYVDWAFLSGVRLGRGEVEVSGSRDEVLKTFEDLPKMIALFSEALGGVSGDVEASGLQPPLKSPTIYTSIRSSGNCSDAVLQLLGSDWGRLQPRNLPELIDAMQANAVHYPATTLSGVLSWLVRRGKIKRWKTEKGYVYVLRGEKET